jgi:phage gpG-like protein
MGIFETLDKLESSLKDPAKLQTVGIMASQMIASHIQEGKGFAPISPVTAAYRKPGRPLLDTGDLRNFINSPNSVKILDDKTVSIRSNKPYASILNDGGVIRAKKDWLWIPAAERSFMKRYGFSPSDVLKGLKAEGILYLERGELFVIAKKSGHGTRKES